MKAISKKLLALCCATALVLGLNVVSFAAGSAYSVNVTANQVQVIKNGKTASSYAIKSSDITLSSTAEYPLIISFKDADSKKKSVSLGSQSELNISGNITSLTLDNSLLSTFTLNIGESSVSTLTVHFAGKVIISNKADVNKVVSSNKSASIKTAAGKTVSATTAKAPAATVQPVKKPVSSSSSSSKKTTSSTSSAVTLTAKPINASKGDTLNDLVDQLNENVTARDASQDYVMGESKWTTGVNREVTEDMTMSYTFYPDMEAYPPVKGSVKIYTDGNSEDIVITYQDYTADNPLVVSDGDRLSEFTADVKDSIYVENDNGDTLDYTFKWVSSSTKFNGTERLHAYRFKITPKNSRYLSAEGTIYIIGSNAQ